MSSSSITQIMKPLLLRAGIPAALSVAAYICAKFISKRLVDSETNYNSNSLVIPSFDQYEEERHYASMQIIENNTSNLEDKLLELEIHVENLQKRERDLKRELLRYRAMKEREFMLMEIRYKMMLEKTRAEFMMKEVCIVQVESQRMGGFIFEYIKVVKQVVNCNKENELLKKKTRMWCKTARQRLKIIKDQKLKIEAREKEVLSNQEELQRRDGVIQGLKNEVIEMKKVIDHLKREKIELSNNLDIAQRTFFLNPKNEKESDVTKEEHEKVPKEVEQMQKDREVDANACLKHNLLKCHEHNKGENEQEFELEDQQHVKTDNCDCNTNTENHPSRRRRFIQKVKKWVEGGKMDEVKCFRKLCSCDEAEDSLVHQGRKSCSSV